MVVVVKHATVIQKYGLYAGVKALSDEVSPMHKIPIVDAVITYDCQFTLKPFLLIVRNALHIPSMDHNLIPPFIMREAGLTLTEQPKRQCETPTVDDHSIFDIISQLRIHLKLNRVFSYFPTRKPTDLDVVFLMPDAESWDPHNAMYAKEEEVFIDTDGYVMPRVIGEQRRLISENYLTDVQANFQVFYTIPILVSRYEDLVYRHVAKMLVLKIRKTCPNRYSRIRLN